MVCSRLTKPVLAFMIIGAAMTLGSCRGGGWGDTTGPLLEGDHDVMTLSINGGAPVTYTEASGLPEIECDPRVDWDANQVILRNDFTGGSGPSGYEYFFEIMFASVDSVGTYTVHGDFCQAFYHDGLDYRASSIYGTSDGTVHVSRSDTRIEGTFSMTLVDAGETTSVTITGSFAVDQGFSRSCP